MINLCTAYFDELMSKGYTEACHRLLAHNVEHKDMVGGWVGTRVGGRGEACRPAGLCCAAGSERSAQPDCVRHLRETPAWSSALCPTQSQLACLAACVCCRCAMRGALASR